MMTTLIAMVVFACAPTTPEVSAPDRIVVEHALEMTRPSPLLEFAESISSLTWEDGCPLVDVLEYDSEGTPIRETWHGGCALDDGTYIGGVLDIYQSDDGAWVAGDQFSMSQAGDLELYLDGALESFEQESLLFLDASATWCGGEANPCADGTMTVDLLYSLYPAYGYPEAYDLTVSGVVAYDTPITIDGSWTVDLRLCDGEPTNGTFALNRGQRHDLTMDGNLQCDSCAAWSVQGMAAPAFCGVDL